MKWLQTVIIAIALVVSVPRPLAQTVGEIGVVGQFIGDGPWTRWSGRWLALIGRDGGFELQEVAVNSTREKPVCGDVGFAVNARDVARDSLLLRGFPAVKAGRVVAAFHGSKSPTTKFR